MYTRANPPTEDDVLGFHSVLSNWGRWGDDDQMGTLNLITPEVRKRAAAAVRHGESVSCSWEIPAGPGGIERTMNVRKFNTGNDRSQGYIESFYNDERMGSASEHLAFHYHDARFTHLDSLCHQFWDGTMYNGRPAEAVDLAEGATFGAVTAAAAGMVTRGVLIDIPGLRGVDWLEKGDGVYPDDLEAAEERQGVRVQEGDAVLLRTGHDRQRRETGELPWGEQQGWHAACLPWLRERGVSYVGCDTGTDVIPSGYPNIFVPVHTCALVAMGLWLIDHCDLYECAQVAERLQQWDFLLSVSPARFAGTSGSPVNPIATF